VLNVSVDVTDQETAEQALYQKNMQLLQSNTSLEEYAYVASHDLKEPLRKISTFSDRILTTQNSVLNDEAKIYLSKIIDASRRMQKMINDLLSVSTISGNKGFEPCDLKDIFEQAIVPLEHKIEERKAIIETDALPTACVVPSQFRQLFQNLVSNSLKFAKNGSPCHIKITHKFLSFKSAERFNLAKGKRYLQIQLEDNGIGFDNEYAGKIFAMFQRLHGKADYDGSGIGLAICKKIAENHGGIIFAQGIVNQGATFTIVLPQ
jgi:light-regulated signal transduction histidine kinase (bacteriophytochrome)